jgi:hypothetical protein
MCFWEQIVILGVALSRRWACAAMLVGVCVVLPGCGIAGSSGKARLKSMETGSVLAADLTTRVYRSDDPDTADFYLTDLPSSVWNAGADVSDMSGVLIHIHMFLRPKAGHTPIEDTASTAVVRCLVLAKGEIGVYGGGGFFVNDGTPGGKSFGGSVRNASLRLVRHTDGFVDRLGPCTFAGSVSGKQDLDTAMLIDRAGRALAAEAKPVNKPIEPGPEVGPPEPSAGG